MVMMNMNTYVPEPYMDEIFHYPMTSGTLKVRSVLHGIME